MMKIRFKNEYENKKCFSIVIADNLAHSYTIKINYYNMIKVYVMATTSNR